VTNGLSLSSHEKYVNNLILHLEKISHILDLTFRYSKIIEILNYELRRHNISSNIKLNYNIDFPSINYTDAVVVSKLFDSCLTNKNNFLGNIQKSKENLSQVDAATNVYFLPVISKLKVLDLEQSNVNEVAAFELAALLRYNGVLEQLWLGGNQLSSAGAIFALNSLVCLSALK